MKLTPAEFTKLATGACLYVTGIPAAFPIVQSGVAGPAYWVLCPDEGFHILPTLGLELSREGDTLTWRDPGGAPALVITPLSACEELSAGDVLAEIETARSYYETTAADWLRQQISGAAEATPQALRWTPQPSTF